MIHAPVHRLGYQHSLDCADGPRLQCMALSCTCSSRLRRICSTSAAPSSVSGTSSCQHQEGLGAAYTARRRPVRSSGTRSTSTLALHVRPRRSSRGASRTESGRPKRPRSHRAAIRRSARTRPETRQERLARVSTPPRLAARRARPPASRLDHRTAFGGRAGRAPAGPRGDPVRPTRGWQTPPWRCGWIGRTRRGACSRPGPTRTSRRAPGSRRRCGRTSRRGGSGGCDRTGCATSPRSTCARPCSAWRSPRR